MLPPQKQKHQPRCNFIYSLLAQQILENWQSPQRVADSLVINSNIGRIVFLKLSIVVSIINLFLYPSHPQQILKGMGKGKPTGTAIHTVLIVMFKFLRLDPESKEIGILFFHSCAPVQIM